MKKTNKKKHTFNAWLLLITSCVIICSFILCLLVATLLNLLKIPAGFANTTLYFLLIIAISSIIDFVIIIPISKRVTANLEQVKNAMNEVGNGNLNIKLKPTKSQLANELVEDFNTMVKELNSNSLMRRDFISNFSHEFKTPIVSVHGFAKILLEHPELPEEQKKEYLQIIVEQSERLSNLASNTLLISKIDNQSIIEKQNFSLDENIRETVILFANTKNLELNVDLQEIQINASKDLLSQVWVNLFNNAYKFADKKIDINLTKTDNTAILTISNDGTTITDQQKQHIFDKFYQADNSRSTTGYGLGLSIAKTVVELHNGTIECNNNKPNLTKFIVKLPINNQ